MAFQVEEEDYVEAIHLRVGMRTGFKIALAGIAAMCLAALVMMLRDQSASMRDRLIIFGCALFFLSFAYHQFFGLKRGLRKTYRQSPDVREAYEMRHDGDGIHVTGRLGSALIPWDYFVGWVETGRSFILLRPQGMLQVVPRRGFVTVEAAEEFRTALITHVAPMGKTRGRGSNGLGMASAGRFSSEPCSFSSPSHTPMIQHCIRDGEWAFGRFKMRYDLRPALDSSEGSTHYLWCSLHLFLAASTLPAEPHSRIQSNLMPLFCADAISACHDRSVRIASTDDTCFSPNEEVR